MSQTKYKLPDYVKQEVLSYIKGYDARCRVYLEKRDAIINSSACAFSVAYNHSAKSDENRTIYVYHAHSSSPSNPTENKFLQLDELERHSETLKMRAVEQAKAQIGADILSDEVRCKLAKAIWYNCLCGKNYPYEILDVPTIYRDLFYEIKRKFLCDIAYYSNILY